MDIPFGNAKNLSSELFARELDFEDLQQRIWQWQCAHNPRMASYRDKLRAQAPVSLPIDSFKYREMKCGDWEAEMIFESSGTTGQVPSRHHIKSAALYRESCIRGFYHAFPKKQYRILALLPHYLERGNSSLVNMVRSWMEEFGLPGSDFFLHDFDRLARSIREAMDAGEPLLLIGVAFALLDFVESNAIILPPDALVLETGGMKGRKREMIRKDLHAKLKSAFGIGRIHSEYGMTELLSQAYTGEDGRFRCPPWMRVRISDIHLDSLEVPIGSTGRIHVADLANLYSCAFIATDDVGRQYEDGSFEVLGRLDTSEMRGCNLMYV